MANIAAYNPLISLQTVISPRGAGGADAGVPSMGPIIYVRTTHGGQDLGGKGSALGKKASIYISVPPVGTWLGTVVQGQERV